MSVSGFHCMPAVFRLKYLRHDVGEWTHSALAETRVDTLCTEWYQPGVWVAVWVVNSFSAATIGAVKIT